MSDLPGSMDGEYRLVGRGADRDLVHVSAVQIAGRLVRVREIIRSRIPLAEIEALLEPKK